MSDKELNFSKMLKQNVIQNQYLKLITYYSIKYDLVV